jgi:hypothetical protein
MVRCSTGCDASSPELSGYATLTLRRPALPDSEGKLLHVFIWIRKVIVEIVNQVAYVRVCVDHGE